MKWFALCSHRFLVVKDIDHTRSVEMSRCYECGTPLIRLRTMSLSTWFPCPPQETSPDTEIHLTTKTDAIS